MPHAIINDPCSVWANFCFVFIKRMFHTHTHTHFKHERVYNKAQLLINGMVEEVINTLLESYIWLVDAILAPFDTIVNGLLKCRSQLRILKGRASRSYVNTI